MLCLFSFLLYCKKRNFHDLLAILKMILAKQKYTIYNILKGNSMVKLPHSSLETLSLFL